jgi:hypothetical protein
VTYGAKRPRRGKTSEGGPGCGPEVAVGEVTKVAPPRIVLTRGVDTLLPRLLSGELRVKIAEKIIEEAV